MPQEIELKLAVDPRDVLRLRESRILRESSLKHTARKRLVSTYYDTPSFSLLQAASSSECAKSDASACNRSR